jgi:hypothetical protein
LHSWFDRTKSAQNHFTHRALRHHVEGISVAEGLFGNVQVATGASVRELGEQHMDEDVRRIPTAADWLNEMEAPEWLPVDFPGAQESAEIDAARLGADPACLFPLYAWFMETEGWFEDSRHLSMRHHTFGIFEAEDSFGVVMRLPSGTVVPTRYLAERHVYRVLGRVPAATDWLRRIKGRKWMGAARKPGDVLGPDIPVLLHGDGFERTALTGDVPESECQRHDGGQQA